MRNAVVIACVTAFAGCALFGPEAGGGDVEARRAGPTTLAVINHTDSLIVGYAIGERTSQVIDPLPGGFSGTPVMPGEQKRIEVIGGASDEEAVLFFWSYAVEAECQAAPMEGEPTCYRGTRVGETLRVRW